MAVSTQQILLILQFEEETLDKEKAVPKLSLSSTFAWEIPWTEEPGRLQSMGSRRVGLDWATSLWLFTFMHWRRKWQPTPVLLPGESQGREPGGMPSMGSHRVGHDWCYLAVAAAARTWCLKVIVILITISSWKSSGMNGGDGWTTVWMYLNVP